MPGQLRIADMAHPVGLAAVTDGGLWFLRPVSRARCGSAVNSCVGRGRSLTRDLGRDQGDGASACRAVREVRHSRAVRLRVGCAAMRGRTVMWTCSTCAFPAMTWVCRISRCRRTWRSSSAGLLTLSRRMACTGSSGIRSSPARRSCSFPRADGSRTGLAADSAEPPLAGSMHYLVQVAPPPLRHLGQPGFDQLEPVEEAQDIRTAAV